MGRLSYIPRYTFIYTKYVKYYGKFKHLPKEIQDKYLRKAKYLIEYYYVENQDVETLAEQIYIKTGGPKNYYH